MKYTTAEIVFREVPDEITMAINISGCKIHCPDCHSKYLWEDIGTELTKEELESLIEKNQGITCVCFMGGQIEELEYLWYWIYTRHPFISIAWYTGENQIPYNKALKYLDYIKIGPYIKEKGGLDNPNTNQKFYAKGKVMHKMDINNESFYNITDKFWVNESKDKKTE